MHGSQVKQRSKTVYRDAQEGHRSATRERRDGQPKVWHRARVKDVYMGAAPHTPPLFDRGGCVEISKNHCNNRLGRGG